MIRRAEDRDIVPITELLREYSQTMDMEYAKVGFSPSKVANSVSSSIRQGFAWVNDEDGVNGVLTAQEQYNVFSDNVTEVQLLAIYVLPECRNGMVGGRLLKAFDKECEDRGVRMTWIGTQYNSELNKGSLERLGYKLQELQYLKER